jgi:hypothetical protein
MPYGKPLYDPEKDQYTCEYPIKNDDGTYTICNKTSKDLVRHITRAHGITADEYRKMMGLRKKESLMSKKTTQSLRKANRKHKAYENLKPIHFKKGENKIQSYTRSPQDRARLRKLHLYRKREVLKKED